MPSTPLPQNVLELLAQPNPAVMATLAADGRPVTVATWYLLELDGTMLLGLDASRARLNHLRRDPRVSLTALARNDWYTHVSVQGHVVSLVEEEGLHDIDRLSQHYTGQLYRNRERPASASTSKLTAGTAGAAAHQSATDPLSSARERLLIWAASATSTQHADRSWRTKPCAARSIPFCISTLPFCERAAATRAQRSFWNFMRR